MRARLLFSLTVGLFVFTVTACSPPPGERETEGAEPDTAGVEVDTGAFNAAAWVHSLNPRYDTLDAGVYPSYWDATQEQRNALYAGAGWDAACEEMYGGADGGLALYHVEGDGYLVSIVCSAGNYGGDFRLVRIDGDRASVVQFDTLNAANEVSGLSTAFHGDFRPLKDGGALDVMEGPYHWGRLLRYRLDGTHARLFEARELPQERFGEIPDIHTWPLVYSAPDR